MAAKKRYTLDVTRNKGLNSTQLLEAIADTLEVMLDEIRETNRLLKEIKEK